MRSQPFLIPITVYIAPVMSMIVPATPQPGVSRGSRGSSPGATTAASRQKSQWHFTLEITGELDSQAVSVEFSGSLPLIAEGAVVGLELLVGLGTSPVVDTSTGVPEDPGVSELSRTAAVVSWSLSPPLVGVGVIVEALSSGEASCLLARANLPASSLAP